MDTLPYELVERIVHDAIYNPGKGGWFGGLALMRRRSHHEPEAARIAATCRTFQKAVESKTFNDIDLDRSRLSEAKEILSRVPHRAQVITKINFKGNSRGGKHEVQTFARDVNALFDFLAWLRSKLRPLQSMALTIDGLSFHRAFDSQSPLHYLDSPYCDPSRLSFVSDLSLWRAGMPECTIPETLRCITSKFANLETLSWGFWEWEHDLVRGRAHRSGWFNHSTYIPVSSNIFLGIANSFDQIPASVKTFDFFYDYMPNIPKYNHVDPPTLRVIQGGVEEELTFKTYQTSQKLEKVDYKLSVCSAQLFWPDKVSQEQLPYWPHLREYYVEYRLCTPAQQQLFQLENISPEPEYPDPRETTIEQFIELLCRIKPIESRLNQFYLAVALAIARMPKLEYMKIELDAQYHEIADPHQFSFDVGGRTAIATWHCSEFIPDSEVIDTMKKAAYHRDLELVVRYTSSAQEYKEADEME
ncbi:uncharacterized protein F4822DRAFT_374413 [Hypoxylon trugodes]|uniref:uncharacterized protein n=1 Tax=Hypoxylon trugodes TaxID=326681 RepID=UPI0021998971|nr:uncharacterized protein F4822DRAFT_374413 [Hypoxylon trugodes]KAI1384827.1 hypothetical protein F4822DRAFT_374413 [Hypoxylon trugodes]